MSRTGKFGTGGSAGRTCPVGKPPTPGNGRTCQPDLPIRGEAGQERCGESETQRPVSGVASRSDSETRGEINSPSRAPVAVGPTPEIPSRALPVRGAVREPPNRGGSLGGRRQAASTVLPNRSVSTETETGGQGNMPLPGGNAEPQRSEMYELTAADFRDGLAGHRTVLPNGRVSAETGRLAVGATVRPRISEPRQGQDTEPSCRRTSCRTATPNRSGRRRADRGRENISAESRTDRDGPLAQSSR